MILPCLPGFQKVPYLVIAKVNSCELFYRISVTGINLKLFKSSDCLFLLFVSMLHVFVQKYFSYLTCFPLVSRFEKAPHTISFIIPEPFHCQKVKKFPTFFLLEFSIHLLFKACDCPVTHMAWAFASVESL